MVRAERVVQTALMVLQGLLLYQERVARQQVVALMPLTARREFLGKAMLRVLMVHLVHQEQVVQAVQTAQVVEAVVQAHLQHQEALERQG